MVYFIAHRKAKKAPITETAIKGFQHEADKACISLSSEIEISIMRGWTGFNTEWLKQNVNLPANFGQIRQEPPRCKFNLNDED